MEWTEMTMVEKFEVILKLEEVQENENYVEFIENEIGKLNRKAERAKARRGSVKSKKAIENEKIATEIFNLMETGVRYTPKAIGEMKSLSPQKVTAVMKYVEDRVDKLYNEKNGRPYYIVKAG